MSRVRTIRSLLRTPGFTAVVVLTLGLGIGANTAIFSLINAVMLRTLPLASPDELYFVAHGTAERNSTSSNYPFMERLRSHTDTFAGVTAFSLRTFKISTGDGTEMVTGQFVSGNYHALLGAPMALGRGFASEDDRAAGASAFAVISDSYWARRFGRSPAAIGATLTVDGFPVSVVGVTADGFRGLASGTAAEVTLPISMRLIQDPGFLRMQDGWTSMPLVARLNARVTEAQAAAVVDSAFQQYMSEPDNRWARTGTPDAFRTAFLVRASHGSAELRTQYGTTLTVLMTMVGLFLVIACINVANLLLVRATGRAREVAIRMSLGASRIHLLRESIVESTLLAVMGGALGVVLAVQVTRLIAVWLRSGQNPIIIDVYPDAVVLAFTGAVSLGAGLVFGIAPAFSTSRLALTPALQEGRSTADRSRLVVRKLLVASQIALCVFLVFGAGLLVRTLRNLTHIDAGFNRENVLLFELDAGGTPFPAERLPGFCADLLQRLHSRPGVASASCSTTSPLNTRHEVRGLNLPQLPPTPEARGVWVNVVSPQYFDTMGIHLRRGRLFTPTDTASSAKVAVVNERMAGDYFGASDPVGRTISFMSAPDDAIRIIGVVEDSRHSLREQPPRMVYTVLTQIPEPADQLTAAVRTIADPAPIVDSIRAEAAAVSKDVAVSYVRTMEQHLADTLTRERLVATLAASFGALALVLACIGLYGVVSYQVSNRTREIGIRLALGANPRHVLWSIVAHILVVAMAGTAAGMAAALLSTSALSALVFGVSTRDPLTLIATMVVLVITCTVAAYIPARRAARVDPVEALRYE